MGITTDVKRRKDRRKEKREGKRKRQPSTAASEDVQPPKPPRKKAAKRAKTKKDHDEPNPQVDDPYAHLDATMAAELRREDAEIQDLESKLNLGRGKEKDRLYKDFAKQEGYGVDFGDFLENLDTMAHRISHDGDYAPELSEAEDEVFSDEDEGVEPMKDPADEDDDMDMMNDMENSEGEEGSDESPSGSDVSDDESHQDPAVAEPDHDDSVIYHPAAGQDIYGNVIDDKLEQAKPSRYVPPHLRKAQDGKDREEKMKALLRSLNNAINRLSGDTLVSVAQTLANLYDSYPAADVNESLWKVAYSAVVDKAIVMQTMIPVYVACLVGVHLQSDDRVQLGGFLLEKCVSELWAARQAHDDAAKKESNLTLFLCYLYNFSAIDSAFMFDLVRDLIESFKELDIELLLIILSHSGFALRSDDPSALKEIVMLVQSKQAKSDGISSRTEYMISAMADLKNNKRHKVDVSYGEKTVKLRKLLGSIKSGQSRPSSSCLRIRLTDILNVEAKGRWWKVGASWVGNQFKHNSEDGPDAEDEDRLGNKSAEREEEDEEKRELLRLASKYRMNSDTRRSIFFIVMSSADCDDAFEKLVRAGLLKNRSERDCVRVLMECCGNEKKYNPFYSHLATRICDYQAKCKFTFQLAFWDSFKQWESMSDRKAANLAKLLCHLVVQHQSLKLNVLKMIDMTQLEDTAQIFLTIFFSNMLEAVDDPDQIADIFERGIRRPKPGSQGDDDHEDGLRESLLVFLLQTLKASPKNKKKSKFRANLKASIKACETNELDTMVPASSMT